VQGDLARLADAAPARKPRQRGSCQLTSRAADFAARWTIKPPPPTIIWTIWAILYQQIENNVIQPRIQARAVDVQPFVVLVAVLFGSTLFGVIGARVAVPLAATIQIVIREGLRYRNSEARAAGET
jgi:predicted PurR-regulated permease PerM